ncbi:unnamed protein product, partial [Meganyctiphanes norvegica]
MERLRALGRTWLLKRPDVAFETCILSTGQRDGDGIQDEDGRDDCPDCAWRALGLLSRHCGRLSASAGLADARIFHKLEEIQSDKILRVLQDWSLDNGPVCDERQSPAGQFLCLKNIKMFLLTCEKEFGIRGDDLFRAEMLFEFTDLAKVLSTLSKLSKSPKAQKFGKGFPPDNQQRTDKEEEIYKHLADFNGARIGDSPLDENANKVDPTEEEASIDEDLLDVLDSVPNWDDALAEVLFGYDPNHSSLFGVLQPKLLQEIELRPREKRDYNLLEIMDTENNYVSALKMLIDEFYNPLIPVIGQTKCEIMFFKIHEMYSIHKVMHSSLKDAINNKPQTAQVSQVFLVNQEKLLIYGAYCGNLQDAQSTVENEIDKNDKARLKIQECQNKMSQNRHKLTEYLVVPLQRILKYHLLLKELVSNTTENHEDYNSLKLAHEAMMDLSEYINEVKRDQEMKEIINALKKSICNLPEELNHLDKMGKLRQDDEINIGCHPDNTAKKRFVFMFDRVMIICKQARKVSQIFGSNHNNINRWSIGEAPTSEEQQYTYKDHIMLDQCKIEDTGTLARTKNSFYLVVNGNKKAYTITNAKNHQDKNAWMKGIQEAIAYLNPPENQTQHHKFDITTFERPDTRCSICDKLMKGCFFQGYRCAACKQVVHKSCLSKVDKCHGCALTAPICPIPKNRGPQIVPDPRFGPTIPQPPQDHSITNDYWNLQVTEYPWWVERMSRIDSTALLISTTEGTFLLRWSDNHNQPILSLKAMGEVKHMRVNRQDETGYFFLSEARFFRSIVELINYHYANLLAESFQGLERTLTRPVYDTAVVRFTYSAPPSGNNHLSMLQGERVVVISRDGEARGWWKGRIGTRVGYFPKEYVTLDNEPF